MSNTHERIVTIDRHRINLTNEAKVFFPKSGITKGDIIAYYQAIAPTMLPYLKDRALSMVRYPDGISGEHFFQKNVSSYYPDWIMRATIPKLHDGENIMAVCNNASTLVYLANQACLTPHTWLSRIDKLDYPDRLIFDLDPADTQSFTLVQSTALALKAILESLDLTPFVMTTGSRGMHVIVPIKRTLPFDDARAVALSIATMLVAQDPQHLTTDIRKDKRGGKLFIDCNRNAFAQTSVAPYAIRAYEDAPIAAPISWKEAADEGLTAQRYTITTIFEQLAQQSHPWDLMKSATKSISNLLKKVD